MKESQRIAQLFKALFDGHPWLEVNLLDTLNTITATSAEKQLYNNQPSIWQLLNHVVNWRNTVLDRLHGNIIDSPANNYFETIPNTSASEWQEAIHALCVSQQKWINYLDQLDDADLEKIYPGNMASYYDNIHGILQHDAYHLGQIRLLAKYC